MNQDIESEEIDELEPKINITPLINVSLVLVLVFMVTSPYFVKQLINVQLPKAVSTETEHQRNVTVSISPEEGFSINETRVRKENLEKELRKKLKDSGFTFVLIRADERVPHGEVEDVMRIANGLGVKRIAFATAPKLR